ncbi:MAG: O-sialoglycoprotein endopeptidase [Peptococcaceae bacterium]|nr:O-sialoglycoprotein endopeptidase [Peptococcaceae bacterium]
MYLGIDTSAYTTSAAVVDDVPACLWEKRQLLEVPLGDYGQAQSKSFFQHTVSLPSVLAEMPSEYWPRLKGIGVSVSPRSVEGSYMPVFRAGVSLARVLAQALAIPLMETSHQEGHIMAGLWSAGLWPEGLQSEEPETERQASEGSQLKGLGTKRGRSIERTEESSAAGRFLAFHISGGTTEILRVTSDTEGGWGTEIIGNTQDLHAGQFVDRVGVSLGLPFPAGPYLAELSAKGSRDAETLLPSSVKKGVVSFSGVESAAQRLIAQKTVPPDVARAVEGCCLRSFAKMIEYAIDETGLDRVLMIGGVAANEFLRARLPARVARGCFYWAQERWSSDNACGTALMALRRLRTREKFRMADDIEALSEDLKEYMENGQ